MDKQKYINYLKSKEWAEIRQDLFLTRGKKCELCESEKHLHIHHLTYERIFNEEPGDLQIVCKLCHEKIHGKKLFKKPVKKKSRKRQPTFTVTKEERKWIKTLRKQKRRAAIKKKWHY